MRCCATALCTLLALASTAIPARGNNVTVTNTSLVNPAADRIDLQFDLSWDHSWRDGVNHDACWVFAKYSIDAGETWRHATLAGSGTNPAGFATGSGTGIDIWVPEDRKGAFVQRAANGTGTVAVSGVTLQWGFLEDGVSASRRARVKVFAIEMVYVPEASYYLGSGGTESGRLFEGGGGEAPFLVSSNGAIACGDDAGKLWGSSQSGSSSMGGAGTIPAAFPNGYQAFYLMKTEISQGQYCDFLNTLTAVQQDNRFTLAYGTYRNVIKKTADSPAVFGCDGNNNAGSSSAATVDNLDETNDGEWVACNRIYWEDGTAYADWAALRPMTELEYEKACRGPLTPVTNEYVWGNTTVEAATSSLSSPYTASETPNRGNCNSYECSPPGAYRCGSYADGSSSRQNAGAAYYGALDMGGNVWERCITIGSSAGRLFPGTHGDGLLSEAGNANEANWNGWGLRGGGNYAHSYDGSITHARISSRANAASTRTDNPYVSAAGWRGCRTGP